MKKLRGIIVLSSLVLFGTLTSCGAGGDNASEDGVIKIIKAEFTKDPSKLEYKEGEKFSTNGAEVLATYSDGETKTFKTGFKASKTDALTTDDTKITVSWTKEDITIQKEYTITVTGVAVKSFELTSGKSSLSVASLTTLDLSNDIFTITYDDDTTEEVYIDDSRLTVTDEKGNAFKNGMKGSDLGVGDHEIRVTYKEHTVTIAVNVYNGYKIEGEYLTGEESPSGDSRVKARTSAESDYLPNPSTNLDTGNGSICGIKEPTASNGQFLGGISAGAVIEFYFKTSEASTAHLILSAASNWIKEMNGSFPSWTGDVVAKDMFTITCNGANVAVPDDSVLEGSGGAGQEGTRMNYRNFKEVDLGTVTLAANTVNSVIITYKTSAELAAIGRTDPDTGKNVYMNSNSDSKYGVPAIDYLEVSFVD